MMHTARIHELVETHKEKYFDLSRAVWELAEVRFEEFSSSALLADYMEEIGFRVERGVAGLPTAFVATAGEGDGPVIGFLGEFDALPTLSQKLGVARKEPVVPGGHGHGCGHNLLGVGALSAAVALRDYLAENEVGGVVKFFGCPAEEGGGGKVLMVKAGVFEGVDIALTWHPSDAHYVGSSSCLATQGLIVRFKGRSAHAAKSPHLGRSALDAVELMNVGCNYLREHVPSDARFHYAVLNTGGFAPNVVQEEAEVRYQVRSPKSSQVEEIVERICKVAEGAALMTETTVEITRAVAYKNIVPIVAIESLMHENLEALGLPEYSEEERAFAREIRATIPPSSGTHRVPEIQALDVADRIPPFRPLMSVHMASTDVGDVSWAVPTAQYRGATWAVGTEAHTWQATAQGATSFAHKGMLQAGKVLAATAVSLLTCPEAIEKARAEHRESIQSGVY